MLSNEVINFVYAEKLLKLQCFNALVTFDHYDVINSTFIPIYIIECSAELHPGVGVITFTICDRDFQFNISFYSPPLQIFQVNFPTENSFQVVGNNFGTFGSFDPPHDSVSVVEFSSKVIVNICSPQPGSGNTNICCLFAIGTFSNGRKYSVIVTLGNQTSTFPFEYCKIFFGFLINSVSSWINWRKMPIVNSSVNVDLCRSRCCPDVRTCHFCGVCSSTKENERLEIPERR